MTTHYGICVPNLGEFAHPRRVAAPAKRAEEAGWDGFSVWDHVVFPYGGEHEVAAALAGVARGFLRPADAAELISAAAKSSVGAD
jgi:hypothetical protein